MFKHWYQHTLVHPLDCCLTFGTCRWFTGWDHFHTQNIQWPLVSWCWWCYDSGRHHSHQAKNVSMQVKGQWFAVTQNTVPKSSPRSSFTGLFFPLICHQTVFYEPFEVANCNVLNCAPGGAGRLLIPLQGGNKVQESDWWYVCFVFCFFKNKTEFQEPGGRAKEECCVLLCTFRCFFFFVPVNVYTLLCSGSFLLFN